MLELALCLSGGGYRAAVYHLGVLTYLNRVGMPQGGKLLDRVHTITCISGGALPGICYMLALARRENLDDSFKRLFNLLINNGLSEALLNDFEKQSKVGIGLIQVLAKVYDDVFFHDAKFGEILDLISWDGIHHFSVDATDFELGMPFRFQATDRIVTQGRREEYGVIGNSRHKIEREAAREIRLADIMAATSCFPLVFEPLTYPDDFVFGDSSMKATQDATSYVLMDGGLVDNQGIDPALHAEDHLNTQNRSHDVLVLSDAGNLGSEEEKNAIGWNKKSPDFYFWLFYGIAVVSGIGACYAWFLNLPFLSGCCTVLTLCLAIFLGLLRSGEEKVINLIKEHGNVAGDYQFLWSSPINNIATFLRDRFNTAHRMVDVIMMGHIKKSSYQTLFNSNQWKNRVMLNSLFIFSSKGKWDRALSKRNVQEKSMTPSRRIRQNSDKANKMKTTLWFTEEEIKTGMPEAILACGQYTICWNLLQQIDRLQGVPEDELTDGQKELIGIKGILTGDWIRFNQNPRQWANSYKEERL